MRTIATASLLFTSALLGCSSEPTPAPTSTPPVVIPTQFPATLDVTQFLDYEAAVECAAMFACPSTLNGAALRIYLGDYARCDARRDLLPGAVERRRNAWLTSAGRLRFDASAARRCLEAQRTSYCVESPDCAAVFVGTTPEGMTCVDRRECAGDAYCSFRSTSGSYNCPGRCTARLPLGSQCPADSDACSREGALGRVDCMYDQNLSGRPYPFTCRDRGPVIVASEGAECADRGIATEAPRTCAAGLDCRYVATATGARSACMPPAPSGEACSRYCQAGSLCEFDGSRFMQRCLPFTVRNSEGEPCIQGNTGSEVCNVLRGLDCVAGRCRRVGDGRENSVCYSGRFGVTSCEAGLYCNSATQTCQRRKADGASCRVSDECLSLACESDSAGQRRCVATPSGC